jgi:hypothetical protein
MDVLAVALDIVIVGLVAWFWPHCARPALAARHASALAYGFVLGVSVLAVGVYALSAVAELAGTDLTVPLWLTAVAGGLWAVIVGLGYFQEYALLRRLTDRRKLN